MLLNDLLSVLAPRIDHTRVVKMFQQADELPSERFLMRVSIRTTVADMPIPTVIKSYLIAVQHVRGYVVRLGDYEFS